MAQLKKLLVIVRKAASKEVLFTVIALILFVFVSWFIIRNFIILINGLNKAFGTDFTVEQQTVTFDREGFDKLNLIKER